MRILMYGWRRRLLGVSRKGHQRDEEEDPEAQVFSNYDDESCEPVPPTLSDGMIIPTTAFCSSTPCSPTIDIATSGTLPSFSSSPPRPLFPRTMTVVAFPPL
ncbi:hypothetical protein LINPERHAP2_LOCUS44313 [Linum perenne]